MRISLFGHFWHLGMLLLWLAEALAAFGSCYFVCLWLGDPQVPSDVYRAQSLIYGGCVTIGIVAMGLTSRRLRDRTAGMLLRVAFGVLAGGAMSTLLLWPLPAYRFGISQVLEIMLFTWAVLFVVRVLAQKMLDENLFKRRVMVFGAGRSAAQLLLLRRRADKRAFRIVGFVPAASEQRSVPESQLLSDKVPLHIIAGLQEIDEIVVAMDDRRQQFPLKDLLACRMMGVEVTELVTFLERETGKVYLEVLNPSWMIFASGFRRDFLRRYTERSFDCIVSLGLLIVASPLMFLAMLAIKVEDGWRAPVIYRQPRVGYAGKVFELLKFRSMRVDAEQEGGVQWASTNDKRVTRVGAVTRKFRIDELPQLWNVFCGHMSFVGPRPERPEFVADLAASIPYYAERHSVKPGITGWAQLNYPYGSSNEDAVEKLQYDLYYVKNHGLAFDLLILLQTAEVILFGKGAR